MYETFISMIFIHYPLIAHAILKAFRKADRKSFLCGGCNFYSNQFEVS